MKYHFIINPVAGKQDASKELVPDIKRAAYMCGISEEDLTIQLTNRPSHAYYLSQEAAKQAAEAGEEIRIFAAGGDGTFNEVLTGAMASSSRSSSTACITMRNLLFIDRSPP